MLYWLYTDGQRFLSPFLPILLCLTPLLPVILSLVLGPGHSTVARGWPRQCHRLA